MNPIQARLAALQTLEESLKRDEKMFRQNLEIIQKNLGDVNTDICKLKEQIKEEERKRNKPFTGMGM